MTRSPLPASLALAAAVLVASPAARGHGGLPIAGQIMFDGEDLVVPTQYWGVFLGGPGRPWRWICSEAINPDINSPRLQRWAFTGDRTYHVTASLGVTSSRDDGCSWVQSTGEIQQRQTSWVTADPATPARAWATTVDFGAPWNALFRTDDRGVTWVPTLQADEYLRGVALGADGQRIYVTGVARKDVTGATTLHVSKDGGKSWSGVTIAWQQCDSAQPPVCFNPARFEPLAVDPLDADTVYLRVGNADPTSILLAARPDGTARELVRADGDALAPGIGGVDFVPEDKVLLVATRAGVYRGVAGGALGRVGTLSRAQCLAHRGSELFACGWNWSPDLAAVAQSSLAGGAATSALGFEGIFTYDRTCGPVTTCGATTPVGMICPDIWQSYADQLGASTSNCGGAVDAGAGGGGKQGGCDVAPERDPAFAGPALALLVLFGGAITWLMWRRRKRRRGRS